MSGSRTGLLVLVSVLALVACTLGVMRWQGERALAQLSPVTNIRRDGYVVRHDRRPCSDTLMCGGDYHLVRVFRGESLVFEETFYEGENGFFAAGPHGFVAALQADGDAELELVVCQDGRIEAIIEPERSTGVLSSHQGGLSAFRARELCAVVGTAGSRPTFTWVVCCLVPIALPVFIAIAIAAIRERREEEREGRTTF